MLLKKAALALKTFSLILRERTPGVDAVSVVLVISDHLISRPFHAPRTLFFPEAKGLGGRHCSLILE